MHYWLDWSSPFEPLFVVGKSINWTAFSEIRKREYGNMDNEKSVKDELAQQLYGVESVVKDSLYDALVSDEMPKNQTLEEHDRRHHHGHFDPSTQTCKFREELSVETENDKADKLDSDKETVTKKQDTDREPNKPTPEEEYQSIVDAYTNPDGSKKEGWMKAPNGKDTNLDERQWVQVRTPSFKEWFGDWEKDPENASKVIDDNGEPLVVWHGGTFTKENGPWVPETENGEMHFGTHKAASERVFDKYGDLLREDPDFKDNIAITPCFLNIRKPKRMEDIGGDSIWLDFGDDDNKDEKGNLKYDGVVYRNGQEDKGHDSWAIEFPNQAKAAIYNSGEFSTTDNDIRHSISDDGDTEEFSEDFWATVNPGRGSSYSSEFGEDDGEALEKYDESFTKDGKYRVPFKDGKFSKEIMDKVRRGGDSDVWDEGSRDDAEAAGRVLSNLLGGVSFELSDKPYEGGGDSRKSISGIYTGSSADYDKPSLLKIGTGEGNQVYGWGLYGSNNRDVAESYMPTDTIIERAKEQLEYLKERRDSASDSYDKERWEGYVLEGEKQQPHRSHYEQTFFTDREPGDESHLLKWYEQVSEEQKKWILDALDKANVKDIDGLKTWEVTDDEAEEDLTGLQKAIRDEITKKVDMTGEDLYRIIAYTKSESPSRFSMGAKAASLFLAKADIDGIKYPVDSYGGKTIKDGDKAGWNYVSFRDDNIRVDHKWVDGEQRYFKNQAGKVVGEYDRKTGKITLYPGAKIKDVVHEFSHGLWQFAEQEAKDGRTGLQDKLHQIAHSAPDAVKDAVGRNYADQNPNVILEECFTQEMARRSEQNKEFAKAIRTARGKKWYQRAWGAIKDTYKGLSHKMGWDKSDVSELDKMDAHEAADWILKQMAKGKRFGDVNPETPDSSDKVSKRKSIIGEKGAANLGIDRLD